MIFGILGNLEKPVIADVAADLVRYLKEKRASFVVENELARLVDPRGRLEFAARENLAHQCDMVVALGGDGTMLATARLVGEREVPILGINLGKLGFLAEVSIEEVHACIDDVLDGRFAVDERTVIQAMLEGDSECFHALNEVVVDRGISPRVIDLETQVDDEYLVTYAADGIIVATATGSTAYSLASGGPIVVPRSGVITINPISPHTLTARAVVVPDSSAIKVMVRSAAKPVHVTADGQVEGFYKTPAIVTIRKANHKVRLVKRLNSSYFNLLRTKLMWGRDLRLGSKEE